MIQCHRYDDYTVFIGDNCLLLYHCNYSLCYIVSYTCLSDAYHNRNTRSFCRYILIALLYKKKKKSIIQNVFHTVLCNSEPYKRT